MTIRNSDETYRARKVIADATPHDMRDIASFNILPGDAAPAVDGQRRTWHYETTGGDHIRHPSAYAKRGWSNMVYCPAEWLRVRVGIGWLASRCKTRAERRSLRAVYAEMADESPEVAAKRAERVGLRHGAEAADLHQRADAAV